LALPWTGGEGWIKLPGFAANGEIRYRPSDGPEAR
jgi:hypothetical protein